MLLSGYIEPALFIPNEQETEAFKGVTLLYINKQVAQGAPGLQQIC